MFRKKESLGLYTGLNNFIAIQVIQTIKFGEIK